MGLLSAPLFFLSRALALLLKVIFEEGNHLWASRRRFLHGFGNFLVEIGPIRQFGERNRNIGNGFVIITIIDLNIQPKIHSDGIICLIDRLINSGQRDVFRIIGF